MRSPVEARVIEANVQESNTYSLAALIEGDAFKNAVKKIPEEILRLEEAEIRAIAKPTKTDYALRMALWNEFRIAHDTRGTIKPVRIYGGICTYTHWYQNVINVPEKLAWLLQPLQEYSQSLEPLLSRISERLFEILNMDVTDAKGKPNPGLLKIQVEAMKMIEGRLLGNPIQRTENKSLSVQMDVAHEGPGNGVMDVNKMTTMEEIDNALAELRKRDRHAQRVIDSGKL